MADLKEKMGMKVPFRYYVSLLRTYLKAQWFKESNSLAARFSVLLLRVCFFANLNS